MYAKRSADIVRGKPHGSVDLGLSVISAKRRRCRIDIDAEVFIYHIKVKKTKHSWFLQKIDKLIFLFFKGKITRRVCQVVRGLEGASSIPVAATAHSWRSAKDGLVACTFSRCSRWDEPHGHSCIKQFWHSRKFDAYFTWRFPNAEFETITSQHAA